MSAPMRISLDKKASLYATVVLRMGQNQGIILFNGDGFDYHGFISSLYRDRVEIEITHSIEKKLESPLKLHLGQCIARGDRMDFILQKATELGIAELTPLFSRYGNVKLSGDRIEKKMEHWQKVIQSACEQCGRSQLPLLLPPRDILTWLSNAQDAKLYLDPTGKERLFDASIDPNKKVFLLVGSEGGLSREEQEAADQYGFKGYRLGPRILRTETAGLTAISILQVRWGDL